MSNESDLVLSLAEEAIRDLARPDVFVSGQAAAYALLAKLSKYRQKQTAGKSAPPLNAHLLPCRRALEAMLGIRGKYPMRADKLGFADGVKWGLDRSRSETQVEVLRQSTAQVREIADHMPTRNDRPGPRRGGTSQAPQDQPPTIINQIYVSQESNQASSSSYSAANTAATSALAAVGAGGKPMCPNGSGCRAPYCFRDNNHPQAPACANGRNCFDSACRSYHDKVAYCGNGGGCAGRDTTCKKAHPWPRPAVPPGNVNARGTVLSGRQKCPLKWQCPGYYGGCPDYHPAKQPCRDGASCRKGAACTYEHVEVLQARSGRQNPVELPGSSSQNRVAELPGVGPRRYELP